MQVGPIMTVSTSSAWTTKTLGSQGSKPTTSNTPLTDRGATRQHNPRATQKHCYSAFEDACEPRSPGPTVLRQALSRHAPLRGKNHGNNIGDDSRKSRQT